MSVVVDVTTAAAGAGVYCFMSIHVSLGSLVDLVISFAKNLCVNCGFLSGKVFKLAASF